MSISMTSAAPSVRQATSLSPKHNPAERAAMRDLAHALKADDLDAARQAYGAIVKNAPAGAVFPRGSQFAELGKALISGDMAAAKDAFKGMVRGRFDGGPVAPPPVALPPQPAAAPGSGLVDVLA